MKMLRSSWTGWVLSLGVAVALGGVAGAAVAKRKPAAEVRAASALCSKKHPKAQAWITELARGENAFLGRLEMVGGGGVPKHRDPTEEYIHVLQGSGVMTIDGVEHRLAPGATVYMPAGAEVSYQNGKENLVALQVFAGPEPAKKYASWKGCP